MDSDLGNLELLEDCCESVVLTKENITVGSTHIKHVVVIVGRYDHNRIC